MQERYKRKFSEAQQPYLLGSPSDTIHILCDLSSLIDRKKFIDQLYNAYKDLFIDRRQTSFLNWKKVVIVTKNNTENLGLIRSVFIMNDLNPYSKEIIKEIRIY